MKIVKSIIVFISIIFIYSCDLFVNQQAWAAGYYTQKPGLSSDLNIEYLDKSKILRISWEKGSLITNYELSYTIESQGTSKIKFSGNNSTYDINISDLVSEGLNYEASNDSVSFSLIGYNNIGETVPIEINDVIPLGEGTLENPYRIIDEATFNIFDFDRTALVYVDILGNLNFGNSSSPFSKIVNYCEIDGNNNTIYYNATLSSGNFLFTTAENNCVIKNINVDADLVHNSSSGHEPIGLLIGTNRGTISNCTVTGSIIRNENQNNTGGMVGTNYGRIEQSSAVNIHINSKGNVVGGLIGNLTQHFTTDKILEYSYSSGTVIGNSTVGGLVGNVGNNTNVNYCFSTAEVDGGSNIGGFAGVIDSSVTDSYSTGMVTGVSAVGGFYGITGTSGIVSISNCYSSGTVSANLDHGGFFGVFGGTTPDVTISNSVALPQLISSGCEAFAGETTGITFNNCSSINTIIQQASFSQISIDSFLNGSAASVAGWNFSTIWLLSSEGPILRNFNGNPEQDSVQWD